MRPLTLPDIERELMELADDIDFDGHAEALRQYARKIGVQIEAEKLRGAA